MDSWSAIQLSKMQCGGNEQLNSIMQQYGLSKHTPIKEKYFSKIAEVRVCSCVKWCVFMLASRMPKAKDLHPKNVLARQANWTDGTLQSCKAR